MTTKINDAGLERLAAAMIVQAVQDSRATYHDNRGRTKRNHYLLRRDARIWLRGPGMAMLEAMFPDVEVPAQWRIPKAGDPIEFWEVVP